MFEYLKGTVTYVCPQYIVVEASGVGYRVLVANPYRYQQDRVNTVYVQQIVRDNDQSLYGFFDLAEKQLFQQLTSVSGIGPKSALAILADNDHQGLIQAIAQNDAKFLTKFPGVGKKTAQQIILDLKDKLPQLNVDPNLDTPTLDLTMDSENSAFKDGLQALIALGYSNREIEKIKPQLQKLSGQDAGEYLRAGLQLLR
ncbi:MAG: Holliday junction branch migration protein RuvA [Lactobacillus sp.]|uniref:Holliday junction branch migration complex subunit RuvA n=1 Tax=Bombilactobacillus bombi TaxID=1303590 RepID=A0A347SQ89_9LACO|nr:Holliday junction branch migration protein RuvA [Bombilactobacillus bombi]MCO6541454.1 Holliday junction branch migration protein RuvA [Lactobacillus sp.]AXX64198.1 Holliday junction branch migration protein RuvA [Bombilactobacillus bombi]MCO6543562.1 Holliday junction branch migration protein RuvA [Lactobacillus sp.]RHW44169.1 Holliday junction branch migration protein RuvA [Bombilactobacillus bombi]RHW51798.1 Holliday junction branch migration protein RuvA [Bombilactobacillus bombi]